MDDFELLQAYASQRKEDAFNKLTGRYINLVYSAAARQTGNSQAAEDVTQAVFLTLARKAGAISRGTVLAGWLLRTTRFAAANARRLEQRRQHYEQQAMQSYLCPAENEAAWQRISPLLDEGLDRLSVKDRDAIALRFLEQKSLKQVAEKLGVSEDGAQKRVTRAIEKLRAFFVRHGKDVSTVALTGALASNSLRAAPATLAASIAAVVTAQGAVVGSAVAVLAQATAGALTRAKRQVFAVRAASVTVLLGLAIITFVRTNQPAVDSNMTAATALFAAETPHLPAVESSQPVVAGAAAPAAGVRDSLLRVVDAQSGEPVTNARLTLVSYTAVRSSVTNIFVTDARGSSLISYAPEPVKSWSHTIEIFRDGYVPKYLSWSEYQQDHIDEIPDQYTAKMDPAVTIGGVVVDEQDVLIAGMKVVFSVSGPIAERARERLTMMGDYHTEVTDARGRWSCSHVPSRFGMIDYRLVHAEYQETQYASDSPESASYVNVERLAQADLLGDRAILRVKRGLAIAGVMDETGQPVAGAKITQGYDFRSHERTTQTAADGSFRFGNGRPNELALTIQAAGLAPVVTSLVVNASMENLRFTLPRGQLLFGRVLDEAEQPVANATIEAASPSSDSRTLFEWRTKTDADGRFSWDAAPAAQNYAVYASGYESQQRITLTADGTEGVIKLKEARQPAFGPILGEVVDAETRMPPAAVSVQIWETTREPGWSSFTTRPEDVAPDGKFRLKTDSGTISYVLEAQADGYWPERLTNQVTGAAEVNLNIELKKAPLYAGVVLTPAGEPAAGATLAVCGPREWAQMNQAGKLHLGAHSSIAGTVSDADGRFRLPPKYAPEFVVAAHGQGFAEVSFSQVSSNTIVTLQPWGRVEGTFILGGQPRANETISLGSGSFHDADSTRLSLSMSTKTDANGHFVFETVPPGERKVDWLPGFRDGKVGRVPFSHGVPVAVKPGETAQATLGGTGRLVVGKLVVAGRDKPIDWTQDVQSLKLKLPTPPELVFPKPADFASESEFTAATQRIAEQNKPFWTSNEGRALQRSQRTYVPLFNGDGSFRIEDVPPGTYTLIIALTEASKTYSRFSQGTPIGALEAEVTVPENSDNTPLDLGALSLTPTGNSTNQSADR